jgi:hypothetical protein
MISPVTGTAINAIFLGYMPRQKGHLEEYTLAGLVYQRYLSDPRAQTQAPNEITELMRFLTEFVQTV